MKAKTILDLLSLSTNLYMISKDEEFMKNFSEMKEKGKEKINDFFDTGDDTDSLGEKIKIKAMQAKQELEHHIEEMVKKLYEKMQIAHLEKIDTLQQEINLLKKEIALLQFELRKNNGTL
jgi:hypothetical protein